MTGGKDMIRSRRSRKIGKLDIVKILAAAFGYTRYFEITTGMTGGVHAEARRAGYLDKMRRAAEEGPRRGHLSCGN